MKSNFFLINFFIHPFTPQSLSFSLPPSFHLRLFEERMNWCLIENINHFAYYRVLFLSLVCCVREKKKVICGFFSTSFSSASLSQTFLFDWLFFNGKNLLSICVCVYESVCNVITYFFIWLIFPRLREHPSIGKKLTKKFLLSN